MRKLTLTMIISSILIFIAACSNKTTNPVEQPHRWYPTDPPQGGTNIDFQIILGSFPVDLPCLPFDIPYNGSLQTMIAKILKNNSPVSGVHVLVKGQAGDSVFLKEFSDLDHLYFPTLALPAFPPEYDYPFTTGNGYAVTVTTDAGSAAGSVIMPYVDLTYPANGATIDISSTDTVWFRWTTVNQANVNVDVAAAILEITGDFTFGPLPIPLPDTFTSIPIPTVLLSTGNVTVYFSAVNMDTLQGSILRYDTIVTAIGDTLIGNYCFPTAFYTDKIQLTFE
ncbi:MAG: hypothetical protein APR63_11305 [Desulfuromonas sp. SDB]|nr:MAG: hypothetical protein APR63_11305 [Desulfuromonas sp. SDB]